jgi:hypothetical protein
MKPDTLLPPIEEPEGAMMKHVYAMVRQQYGKVITPIKVHSARLTNIGLNIGSDGLCEMSGGRPADRTTEASR